MNVMNVILSCALFLSSFELVGQQAPTAPAAPVAPQYPAAKPLNPNTNKDSKDKKEAQRTPQGQKRLVMHDAMIFLDVSEKEPGAITNDFSVAVCQNGYSAMGYPIVVTSYVYNAFLSYDSKAMQEIMPAMLARFDVYRTIKEDFYLLIPKSYLKHAEESYGDKEKQELQKLATAKGFQLNDFLTGFALSKLIKVNNPAQKNIKVAPAIDVASLESVFLQKKDVHENENELLGMWNFALDGHGYYSQQLRQQIGSGLLPQQMKELKEDQFADASVASLMLNQYRELLRFFTQNITTHFLYYSSCYAGGYNSILGYVDALINSKGNVVSTAKPNFIIAAGALTDAVVWGLSKKTLEDYLVCAVQSEKEKVPADTCILNTSNASMSRASANYVNFFNLLHVYTRKDRLAGTIFKDKELRDILNQITIRAKFVHKSLLEGIPQVMFPGTDIFRAVDIDGTISIITESLVKAHALEAEDKKPIVIKDKELILVYPLEIPVEIDIRAKKAPFIFSMPAAVSLQKFEKINFNTLTFKDFLIAISSLAPAFDKYIYIKDLILTNDEYGIPSVVGLVTLKNVLINIKEATLNMIYCDEKGTVYRNYFVSQGVPSYPSELRYPFFDVIKPQNQFLNSLVNYFSEPEVRSVFSYDAIFMKLLSSNEVRTVEAGIQESAKVKHEKMLEIASKEFPHLNIKEIDDALKGYYKISPNVLLEPNLSETHMSPLSTAAVNGDYNGVDALLKVGADIDQIEFFDQRTPLMYAILSKNAKSKNEIVALLLKKGANTTIKDKEGKTAQDMIGLNGPNPEMKKVFEDFEKQKKENRKKMLEDAAKKFPHLNIKEIDNALESYYKEYPDILTNPNAQFEDMPPLGRATQDSDNKAIDALVKVGADINIRFGRSNSTPLMLAVIFGNIPAVKLLLEKGADITLKNKEGKTAGDIIDLFGSPEMKKIFEDFKKHKQDQKK